MVLQPKKTGRAWNQLHELLRHRPIEQVSRLRLDRVHGTAWQDD